VFVPQTRNKPRAYPPNQYYIGSATIFLEHPEEKPPPKLPERYQKHEKVFSEE
jgi:hypothetical protein